AEAKEKIDFVPAGRRRRGTRSARTALGIKGDRLTQDLEPIDESPGVLSIQRLLARSMIFPSPDATGLRSLPTHSTIGMNSAHSAAAAAGAISKIPIPASAALTYTSESLIRVRNGKPSELRNRSSG